MEVFCWRRSGDSCIFISSGMPLARVSWQLLKFCACFVMRDLGFLQVLGLVKDVQTKSGKLYKEWLKCVTSPCLTLLYMLLGQTVFMKKCDVSSPLHWHARCECLLTVPSRCKCEVGP